MFVLAAVSTATDSSTIMYHVCAAAAVAAAAAATAGAAATITSALAASFLNTIAMANAGLDTPGRRLLQGSWWADSGPQFRRKSRSASRVWSGVTAELRIRSQATRWASCPHDHLPPARLQPAGH